MRAAAALALLSAASAASAWDVETRQDPLDDRLVVTAYTRGPGGQALVVRCDAGTLEVFVVWGALLGPGPHEVTWRLGDPPATTGPWDGGSGRATFHPSPAEVVGQLGQVERAAARVHLDGGGQITATWDLGGWDAVAGAISDACPG